MINYRDLIQKQAHLLPVGKFQEDIETFFGELNISEYLDITPSSIQPYVRSKTIHDIIIICDFDHSPYQEILDAYRLVNGQDYIWGEDLIVCVDATEDFYLCQNHAGKRVVVMGVDDYVPDMITRNPHLPIDCFVDLESSPEDGDSYLGRPRMTIKNIVDEPSGTFVIIVAMPASADVKKQLEDYGLIFGRDFYFYDFGRVNQTRYTLSGLLTQTIRQNPRFSLECDYRTRALSIKKHGFVMPCCSSLDVGFGSLLYTSLESMLSSTYARVMQLSIINRTYTFCRDFCFCFRDASKRLKETETAARREVTLPKIAEFEIQLSYDRSCNLACPSCRPGRITSPEDRPEDIEMIHSEVIKALAQNPQNVRVGNGEIFFSSYYKDVFFNHLELPALSILTNGILFNEENWKLLEQRYPHISVGFSIDAASEDTFKQLRGGSFNVLLRNLKFAGQLRKEGKLAGLTLLFVIQNENYREMIDFVRLGRSVSADYINFNKINNWGHFTDIHFKSIDVYDPRNVNHLDFVQIACEPIFGDPDIFFANRNNLLSEHSML